MLPVEHNQHFVMPAGRPAGESADRPPGNWSRGTRHLQTAFGFIRRVDVAAAMSRDPAARADRAHAAAT